MDRKMHIAIIGNGKRVSKTLAQVLSDGDASVLPSVIIPQEKEKPKRHILSISEDSDMIFVKRVKPDKPKTKYPTIKIVGNNNKE